MENRPLTAATTGPSLHDPLRTATGRLQAVASLLDGVDQPAPTLSPEIAFENRLAQVRLGMASSLFAALRAKNGPTASHSLRVAMGCSSWSMLLDLPDEQRDEIEVAALLHDIGKIGIPDHILLKPGRLGPEEYATVERHRLIGADILRSCCASPNVLSIVQLAGGWYNGARETFAVHGEQLPVGARIVSIVDAFDAMTTDQVYRRAMSRERALAELFEHAGTQFDPQLVKDFCGYISSDQVKLQGTVARRWLKDLQSDTSNRLWRMSAAPTTPIDTIDSVFQQKLLDSMNDAVIFVDHTLRILLWNRAAERLTGIPASSIEDKQWSPSLVSLRDDRQKLISDEECPVIEAIRDGVQTMRRLSITGRNGEKIDVDAQLVPVHGKNSAAYGAALLMHDASSTITLEQRVQSLHEKATRDPLTQAANRAEFDRILAVCVQTHLERKIPCSLIICDIDFFKKVNDNFGHQAGDEVLTVFSSLLRRNCRPGDLVARYGGEEFVIICADCDNASATRKAEELRQLVVDTPIAALSDKNVTASFGVTELQNGDTPETMLRRADRALYQAKESGRNRVVQLGSGIHGVEDAPAPQRGWLSWLRGSLPDQVLERTLITAVPLNVVVEKMRGFVADHHAEIEAIEEGHLILRIEGEDAPNMRRSSDRPVPFLVEMRFSEAMVPAKEERGPATSKTLVRVTIRPQRGRDRRRNDVTERANTLLVSLKSYLVAQEHRG
jgi:diguanylate cyclase (GGDEF)-like protein/PAS domain S-box-containing protein